MSELITKDMTEPKDIGPFIVSGTCSEIIMGDHLGDGIWHILPSDADYYWAEIVAMFAGCTMETLAEHDERIRREALTATDEELAVMEAAFDASINDREDDGIGAMDIAMKALAASRERES